MHSITACLNLISIFKSSYRKLPQSITTIWKLVCCDYMTVNMRHVQLQSIPGSSKMILPQKLKKSPQAFRQSHGYVCWLVLLAKNSFGCCLNHCPQPPTQHQMLWMEGFLYPKIQKLHIRSLATCRTSEQLPPHGVRLVLQSVCHMMMGMVMQQHDTLGEITLTFILDLGTNILTCMTVRVCTICVIMWL